MDIVVQAHTGVEKTTVGFQNICRRTGTQNIRGE